MVGRFGSATGQHPKRAVPKYVFRVPTLRIYGNSGRRRPVSTLLYLSSLPKRASQTVVFVSAEITTLNILGLRNFLFRFEIRKVEVRSKIRKRNRGLLIRISYATGKTGGSLELGISHVERCIRVTDSNTSSASSRVEDLVNEAGKVSIPMQLGEGSDWRSAILGWDYFQNLSPERK